MLSGHTDVVPVTGQPWTADPFTLVARDGRLLRPWRLRHEGLPRLRSSRRSPAMLAAGLRHPVILALSRDEEIGCIGTPPMIEAMLATCPAPRR